MRWISIFLLAFLFSIPKSPPEEVAVDEPKSPPPPEVATPEEVPNAEDCCCCWVLPKRDGRFWPNIVFVWLGVVPTKNKWKIILRFKQNTRGIILLQLNEKMQEMCVGRYNNLCKFYFFNLEEKAGMRTFFFSKDIFLPHHLLSEVLFSSSALTKERGSLLRLLGAAEEGRSGRATEDRRSRLADRRGRGWLPEHRAAALRVPEQTRPRAIRSECAPRCTRCRTKCSWWLAEHLNKENENSKEIRKFARKNKSSRHSKTRSLE